MKQINTKPLVLVVVLGVLLMIAKLLSATPEKDVGENIQGNKFFNTELVYKPLLNNMVAIFKAYITADRKAAEPKEPYRLYLFWLMLWSEAVKQACTVWGIPLY